MYTKGEWKVRSGYGFYEVAVDKVWVCQLWSKREEAFTNAEANANLIAQSPRMIELLKRLVTISFDTDDENYEELSPILEDATEIIQTLA